jgi:glc operon protein GlcG
MNKRIAAIVTVGILVPVLSQAQPIAAPPTTPYGPPISFASAKQVMAAAEVEAMKDGVPEAIAIVDSGGNLVMFQRLDNTQLAAIRLSEGKARTALEFRRPTKVLENTVAAGGIGLRTLAFGAMPVDGGFPIIVDGKIAGAIGASGGAGTDDAKVAKAGADAIK